MFEIPASPTISKRVYPDQSVLRVDFGPACLPDWCLSLVLLQHRLVREVSLSDVRSGLRLRLGLLAEDADMVRGIAKWQPNGLSASITATELGGWLQFFLVTYRDRQGPVDHIDVEFRPLQGVSDAADLTLTISRARPPMPGKQARKLLGLE